MPVIRLGRLAKEMSPQEAVERMVEWVGIGETRELLARVSSLVSKGERWWVEDARRALEREAERRNG